MGAEAKKFLTLKDTKFAKLSFFYEFYF